MHASLIGKASLMTSLGWSHPEACGDANCRGETNAIADRPDGLCDRRSSYGPINTRGPYQGRRDSAQGGIRGGRLGAIKNNYKGTPGWFSKLGLWTGGFGNSQAIVSGAYQTLFCIQAFLNGLYELAHVKGFLNVRIWLGVSHLDPVGIKN